MEWKLVFVGIHTVYNIFVLWNPDGNPFFSLSVAQIENSFGNHSPKTLHFFLWNHSIFCTCVLEPQNPLKGPERTVSVQQWITIPLSHTRYNIVEEVVITVAAEGTNFHIDFLANQKAFYVAPPPPKKNCGWGEGGLCPSHPLPPCFAVHE